VHWFKITDVRLAAEVVPLMPAFLVVMVGTLPIGLIWTVFFAYGEIRFASALGAAWSALQTAAFIVAAYTVGNFTFILFAYFSTNIVSGLALTFYVFVRRGWRFAIPPMSRMIEIVRSLARVSFHAFFQSMSGIIASVLGPILSAWVAGLAAAGDFFLLQKLFSFLVGAHLATMAPVAPAVARDAHGGNWDAIRRRLRVYLFFFWPAFFLVLGGIVWEFHPLLIRLWAHREYSNYQLAALLLLLACLNGFVNTFSVFLNSLGLVKVQAALGFAMLLPLLLLPAFLSRWLGMPGIVIGQIVCALPAAIAWPFYTRDALRRQKRRV
jgi:O-antigen/teichoic acid export membrane protein